MPPAPSELQYSRNSYVSRGRLAVRYEVVAIPIVVRGAGIAHTFTRLLRTWSHGLRYGRTRYFDPSASPTITSFSASHRIFRPIRSEMLARWHAVVTWCPSSTSAIGLCLD